MVLAPRAPDFGTSKLETLGIEYVEESELSDVVDLMRHSLLAAAPKYYNPQELENLIASYSVEQFASMIENQSFFCVRHNQKLVATAGWNSTNIQHIYVSPSLFKTGIGSKLVDHAVADFFAKTALDVVNADVIIYARGFFEKCDFKVLSEEKAWDNSAYYFMSRCKPSNNND